MSKGSYSVKYVADFIKRYGMKSSIIRVGSSAVLFGSSSYFVCPLRTIESNVCSYSYVKRVFDSL